MKLVILRPQVGAEATAARAAALGHTAVVAPLFAYRALDWTLPAGFDPDALLFTSAAAVRLGGDGLLRYHALPVVAVGSATADAAGNAGFRNVATAGGDVRSAIAMLAAAEYRHVLHPAGRDHVAIDPGPIALHRVPVYAAEAAEGLSDLTLSALGADAIVLLHSPRAARTFAGMLDESGHARAGVRIACFSPAVADAAGRGWARVGVAVHPSDDALFAAASMLCDQDRDGMLERR